MRPLFFVKIFTALTCGLVAPLLGCGVISLGGGQGINDALPAGTVVAFGTFTAMNGQVASGSVQIYRTTCSGSTCDYVVRLQNLNVTSTGPVTLVGSLSTGYSSYRPQLRFLTGTQNYSYSGVSSASAWVQVVLHPYNLNVGANDLAIANLQSVTE